MDAKIQNTWIDKLAESNTGTFSKSSYDKGVSEGQNPKICQTKKHFHFKKKNNYGDRVQNMCSPTVEYWSMTTAFIACSRPPSQTSNKGQKVDIWQARRKYHS